MAIIDDQYPSTAPRPEGMNEATSPVIAPRRAVDRMAHFPAESYDLSPDSHLMRFMKAVLGDAGIGQVRKRYLLTRLSQTLQGTNFFDLDRFYGALFGMRRRSYEELPIANQTDVATTEEWEEAHAKDASYRTRIEQFGRAVSFGATPTGMELAAEALLNIDCDIYESFAQDNLSVGGGVNTYGEVETLFGAAGMDFVGLYLADDDPNPRGQRSALAPNGTRMVVAVTDSDEAWPRFDTITWPARSLIRSTAHLDDTLDVSVAIDGGENIYYVRADGAAPPSIVSRDIADVETTIWTAPSVDTVVRFAINPSDISVVVLTWEDLTPDNQFTLLRMNQDGSNVTVLDTVPETGGGEPYPLPSGNPVFPGDSSIWFVETAGSAPFDIWRWKSGVLTKIDAGLEGNASESLVPQPDGSVLTQFVTNAVFAGRHGVRIRPSLVIEENDILDAPFTGPWWSSRNAGWSQIVLNPYGTSTLDARVGRYYRVSSSTTYGSLEVYDYGEIEGEDIGLPGDSTEGWTFTIVPKRQISLEEHHDLHRVLSRLKPVFARMIIDPSGIQLHHEVPLRSLEADSEYWQMRATNPRPRPPFSGYQGEAWSYNEDVLGLVGWAATLTGVPIQGTQRTRVTWIQSTKPYKSTYLDFLPWMALASPQSIRAGRAASDGILVSHPYSRPRTSQGGGEIEGQILSGDTAVSTMPGIWVDGLEVNKIQTSLRPPSKTYWATAARRASDKSQEILEVRYSTPFRVNHISFDVARYPHTISVETFNAGTGLWEKAAFHTIRDSIPKTIPVAATTKTQDHPHHSAAGHWVPLSFDFPMRDTTRVRITMTRIANGSPPKQPSSRMVQVFGASFAEYSLAVRALDVGYRARTLADARAGTGSSARDVTGVQAVVDLFEMPATNLKAGEIWRSEPQPVPQAVVNLYADGRGDDGVGQVYDRFYLDPLYNGVHLSLYYNDQDVPADLVVASDEPLDVDVEGTVEPTGTGLDFVSTPAYVDIDPVDVDFDPNKDFWIGMYARPNYGTTEAAGGRPLWDLGGTSAHLEDGRIQVDWYTDDGVNEATTSVETAWNAQQVIKTVVGYEPDAVAPVFRNNNTLVEGLSTMEEGSDWVDPTGIVDWEQTRSTDDATDGGHCLKFEVLADLPVGDGMQANPLAMDGPVDPADLIALGAVPIQEGQVISMSVDARAAGDPAGRQVQIIASYWNDAGVMIANNAMAWPITNEWARYDHVLTIEVPGVVWALPSIVILTDEGLNLSAGEIFYVDSIVASPDENSAWEPFAHPQARVSLYTQINDGEILSDSFTIDQDTHPTAKVRIGGFHPEAGVWPDEGDPDFALERLVIKKTAINPTIAEDFFTNADSYTQAPPAGEDNTSGALVRYHPANASQLNHLGFVGGPGAVFESLEWTPIARDYTLQRGFIYVPPTRARYWKFEFTNLAAQPHEAFLPITRPVRLFPARPIASLPIRPNSKPLAPAMKANKDLNSASAHYSDNILAATAVQTPSTELVGAPRTATSAMHAATPQRGVLLAQRNTILNFVTYQQGTAAPRFDGTGQHHYDIQWLRHTAKLGFFVGLRELRAFRVDYTVEDDTPRYREHFHDLAYIAATTWEVDTNRMYSDPAPLPAVATSVILSSRHPVQALQFATQQSDPVQIIPDDEFRDSGLIGSTWSDLDEWHTIGDAVAVYTSANTTVEIRRNVMEPPSDLGLEQPPDHPIFALPDGVEGEAASVIGGLESEQVKISDAGRIHAAVRFRTTRDITVPLHLQIVSAGGQLLADKAITAQAGEIVEEYLTYVIDSFMGSIEQPEYSPFDWRSIVDTPLQPLTDPPLALSTGTWQGFSDGDGALNAGAWPFNQAIADGTDLAEYTGDVSDTYVEIESGQYDFDLTLNLDITTPGDFTVDLKFFSKPDEDLLSTTTSAVFSAEDGTVVLSWTDVEVPEDAYMEVQFPGGTAVGTFDNGSNLLITPAEAAPPETADDEVRVRLVQYGSTDDAWIVDAFSLYDESIVWEFTSDNVNWYPAYGIRNFVNGVLVFPEGQDGTSLRWRVSAYRPNMQVTSLQVRPWYRDRIHMRSPGHHRGPNISTFDHDPPIDADPEFNVWDKPIPRQWFLAYKPYPTLPIDPNSPDNEFSDNTVRSMVETLPAISDLAHSVDVTQRDGFPHEVVPAAVDSMSMTSTFTRTGDEDVSALTDSAVAFVIPPEEDPINLTLPATLGGATAGEGPPPILYPSSDLFPADDLYPSGPDDPEA